MSDKIQNHIKSIRLKLKQEYEKKLNEEKQKMAEKNKEFVDKLIDKYPPLKNSEIIEEYINHDDTPEETEHVLEQFIHNDKTMFRDKNNIIWNIDGKRIGGIKISKNGTEQIFLYHDPDFESKLNIKLTQKINSNK